MALSRDLTQVIEGTLKAVTEIKQQFQLASRAESDMQQVYEIKRQNTISAWSQYDSSANQVPGYRAGWQKSKFQVDQNNLRISLHRQMLTDQFKEIHGCLARYPMIQKIGFRPLVYQLISQHPHGCG